jgi:nitroreductase
MSGARKGPSGFLAWLMPALAAAAIITILIFLPRKDARLPETGFAPGVEPPPAAYIPFVDHPGIDTLIAGGSRAFARRDYLEAERLLTRARFFVESGINVGEIKEFPTGLSFFAGLSACYRGFPDKGLPMIEEEVERDPAGAMYLYYLAHIKMAEGKKDEGRKFLSRAAMGTGPYGDLAKKELDGVK